MNKDIIKALSEIASLKGYNDRVYSQSMDGTSKYVHFFNAQHIYPCPNGNSFYYKRDRKKLDKGELRGFTLLCRMSDHLTKCKSPDIEIITGQGKVSVYHERKLV